MELHQLQYFILVAQNLSFAKASEQAYVSQQALSKSIIALEKELGIKLFFRLPHGLALTSYGQTLLNNANQILAQVNKMKNDLHNMRLNERNNIRIALTTGVEDNIPIEDLTEFQDRYPDYEISTVASNDKTIEKWLFSETLEIAFLGALGDLTKLDFTLLHASTTVLAIHKDNPISQKASVKLEDLSNEFFLSGSSEYYANNRLLLLCNLLGFNPKIKHTTANILFLSKLVAHNQGIFLCPKDSIQYFDHPNICLIPFEDDPKIYCVYLATKKDHPLSDGVKLFKQYILEKNPHIN